MKIACGFRRAFFCWRFCLGCSCRRRYCHLLRMIAPMAQMEP